MHTSSYLGRYVLFNRPSSHDHSRMRQRVLAASPSPFDLPRSSRPAALGELRVAAPRDGPPRPLNELLHDTATTAPIVVRDGTIGRVVSPDTGVVIVRLSDRFPAGTWWPPVFRQIAEAVSAPA